MSDCIASRIKTTMKQYISIILLIIIIGVNTACISGSHHLGKFSVMGVKHYAAEKIYCDNILARNASGKSCNHIIVIIPTRFPKIDEAVVDAVAKHGGDFLINANVYSDVGYAPFIYGRTCYRVDGDVCAANKR